MAATNWLALPILILAILYRVGSSLPKTSLSIPIELQRARQVPDVLVGLNGGLRDIRLLPIPSSQVPVGTR